jgi:hypothetical protein
MPPRIRRRHLASRTFRNPIMIHTAKSRVALFSFFAVLLVVAGLATCGIGQEYMSGIKWPEPPVVTPGKSNADPPSDAVVLFDGKDLSAWEGGEKWKIENGEAVVQGGDIKTKQSFGDCQLHIEWSAPVPATGSSQGRGNSGVFLADRYEVQILDSYENQTYFDGQASAIYKQTPPMVNAMRPPGEWNTYDIIFTMPRFKENGELEKPAYITVVHNGIVTLNHFEIQGHTPFNEPPKYTQHGEAPIHLQDHGNPVRFRNIWIRELKPIKGAQEREPYFRDGDKEWPVEKTSTAVTGNVSIAGKPLQRGEVTFKSKDATRIGRVREGKFQIDNLQPAVYIVSIHAPFGAKQGLIPAKYADADSSPLRLDVVQGKNEFALELPDE